MDSPSLCGCTRCDGRRAATPAFSPTRGSQPFRRDALPRFDRAGCLRLYLLRFDGAAAAGFYGFSHRGRGYSYLTGFDPAFAFESPGTLVLAHAIEAAIAEGAGEFHFLRGREAYKYEWGAVDRWNRRRSFRRAAAERSVA